MLSIRTAVLALALHCLSPVFAQDPPDPVVRNSVLPVAKIESLGWLQGHWQGNEDGTVTDEYWMPPRGGMMPGVNRTVAQSGRASFEFMRIAETDNGITFFASPQGREATPFLMKELSETHVIFESDVNDFPKRIIYRKQGEELHARIEGTIDGKAQSMQWKWKVVEPNADAAK